MAELKLRNCPFCGFDSPTMRIYKGKDGWRDRYTVICRYDEGGCGAESGMYHSATEAAEAWNRRSDDNSADYDTAEWIDKEVRGTMTNVCSVCGSCSVYPDKYCGGCGRSMKNGY